MSSARRVWYAGYGSNLCRERFLHYLHGGQPAGAARVYPGARDRTPPTRDHALVVPGGIRFGLESTVWGGGMAFYDPHAPGRTRMRAYLVSAEQLADVVAQEMHLEVGADLDLSSVLADGRHVLGPGRYETVHLVGEHDGAPVLTFSAPDPSAIPPNPPAPAYVRLLANGLREAHGLDDADVADYLLAWPGIRDTWDRAHLTALLTEPGDGVA